MQILEKKDIEKLEQTLERVLERLNTPREQNIKFYKIEAAAVAYATSIPQLRSYLQKGKLTNYGEDKRVRLSVTELDQVFGSQNGRAK